jgi:hypothetical protein
MPIFRRRPNVKKLIVNHDVVGLIKALEYQDLEIRLEAARALGWYEVAELLGWTGERKAPEPFIVDELIKTLTTHPESEVRERAAHLLGVNGDTRAVEALCAALSDADGSVREKAATALARLGDARAVEALYAALSDADRSVREKAAIALARLGDARAMEPLIAILQQDEHLSVKESAAEALGRLGDLRAVEPLVASLENTYDESLRQAMLEALSALVPPTYQISGPAMLDSVLRLPVFGWKRRSGDFDGPNLGWVIKVREDNKSAIEWFEAQNFAPLPVGMGEAFVAEYCYDMAYQAQTTANLQEAWAGYHQALRRYLQLGNRERVAMTSWRLGQVRHAQEQLYLAQLYLLHSAYLARRIGNKQQYAWALTDLGKVFKDSGSATLTRHLWENALGVFHEVSPDDASWLEKALGELEEGE